MECRELIMFRFFVGMLVCFYVGVFDVLSSLLFFSEKFSVDFLEQKYFHTYLVHSLSQFLSLLSGSFLSVETIQLGKFSWKHNLSPTHGNSL